jgi:S-sulfosulfanyl-L-cysteine sulfohydrolase
VRNARGKTLVTNAGSNGKFIAVLDVDVTRIGVREHRYQLLPVFADVLSADSDMSSLIAKHRAPYAAKLGEKLAITEGLLYRRGNFAGSLDQLILDALLEVKGAQIAFSPGFRWGTTILPGAFITMDDVMNATAITYPYVVASEMTGEAIKAVLEDICDNLFNPDPNPDPYYQQGGDMVRVSGMSYSCNPTATIGNRITNMKLGEQPIEALKRYRVASWAPVAEGVAGEPVWDVVAAYLRDRKVIRPAALNRPFLTGDQSNPGIAPET